MATGGLVSQISELITCEVCLESFTDKTPRQLTCLHVFCEQCIQSLINKAAAGNPNYDNTLVCPICKVITHIPSGQAANLPVFFHYRKFEDMLKEHEQRHVICGVCKTDTHLAEVKYYCFTCGHGMCKECRQTHDDCFKDHSCIEVTADKMSKLICNRHDSHMEYLCVTCERSICSKCVLREHKGHSLHKVTYSKGQAKANIKGWLEDKLKEAKLSRTYLDEIQMEVDTDIKAAREELKQHRQALIEYINQKHDLLNRQLDDIQQEINEHLKEDKSRVDKASEEIEKSLDLNKRLCEPVPVVPEGQIEDIEKLLSDIKKQIPPTEARMKRPERIRFVAGEKEINFGKITTGVPGVPEGQIEDIEKLMSDVKKQIPPTKARMKRPERIRFVAGEKKKNFGKITTGDRLLRWEDTTLTLTHTLDPGIEWILDMCYLASGQLVVVGFGSRRGLVVFNEDGQKIEHHLSQVHEGNTDLCGVNTDNRDGRVYITEFRGQDTPGYVHRHTPRGHQWTHDTITVCCWPQKVALTTDRNIIVSSYNNYNFNYSLHMYEVSDRGDSRSIWCIQMSGQVSSVCVTSDDTIVVCVGVREVCLLDTQGHQLSRLDTRHPQIRPLGVCLDVCDDILVTDYKSKSLFLYDKKGKFIKKVLSLSCDLP